MKYTLTLSRWHKVAERINAALKEREAIVKAAFTATAISPWNKEGVEEKAADIARRASEALALVEAGGPAGAGGSAPRSPCATPSSASPGSLPRSRRRTGAPRSTRP